MNNEPIYKSEVIEYEHEYKVGIKKKAKIFTATIQGTFNGKVIAHKTEIMNSPFIASLEKEKLYKRYYKSLEEHKLYEQSS